MILNKWELSESHKQDHTKLFRCGIAGDDLPKGLMNIWVGSVVKINSEAMEYGLVLDIQRHSKDSCYVRLLGVTSFKEDLIPAEVTNMVMAEPVDANTIVDVIPKNALLHPGVVFKVLVAMHQLGITPVVFVFTFFNIFHFSNFSLFCK